MKTELKSLCEQAFQRFLRSQPIELDPNSATYDLLLTAFTVGFSEGGQMGAETMAAAIRKDIQEIIR